MAIEVGKKYNQITVLNRIKSGHYLVQCDCGKVYERKETHPERLTYCADCAKRLNSKAQIKHGEHKTRLYQIWLKLRYRCNNPKAYCAKYYHDKGVTYDKTWDDFLVFKEWALQNGYTDELTIDRIDSEKGYYPDNCRWITQSENTKRNSNRKLITINDKTMDIADWCKELGISYSSVRWAVREKGYTHEEYLKFRMLKK